MSDIGNTTTLRFTPRDQALLEDLLEYRYLTTAQISRIHFGGESSSARRRLRKLYRAGLIDRFSGYQAAQVGFHSWVYRLAREGAKQLSMNLGVPAHVLLPPHNPPSSLTHLCHHHALTDFRIWIREGCDSSGGRFRHILIPYTKSVHVSGRRRSSIEIPIRHIHGRLIPDAAMAAWTQGGKAALLFVEIDRGTEPMTGSHRSSIERKMGAYVAAFEQRVDDRFARIFGTEFDGFRVLFVVPDEDRREKFLVQAIRSELDPLAWIALQRSFDTPGNLEQRICQNYAGKPKLALTE